MTIYDRTQAEVQEIGEVLNQQSRPSNIDVWNEAVGLHRVRHETEMLADEKEE